MAKFGVTGEFPQGKLQQAKKGETAVEREQRREALLTYGHLLGLAYGKGSAQESEGGVK